MSERREGERREEGEVGRWTEGEGTEETKGLASAREREIKKERVSM